MRADVYDSNTAYVLIFNPERDNEGVYILDLDALNGRSAYVLAFERTDDAERFAQQLAADGFDMPTPSSWDTAQLQSFCQAGNFEIYNFEENGVGTIRTGPKQTRFKFLRRM